MSSNRENAGALPIEPHEAPTEDSPRNTPKSSRKKTNWRELIFKKGLMKSSASTSREDLTEQESSGDKNNENPENDVEKEDINQTWHNRYVPFNNTPLSTEVDSPERTLSNFSSQTSLNSSQDTPIRTSPALPQRRFFDLVKMKLGQHKRTDEQRDTGENSVIGNSVFHTTGEELLDTNMPKGENKEANIKLNIRDEQSPETTTGSGSTMNLFSRSSSISVSSSMSRNEERTALQKLNSRLAGYIDKVRRLENENHHLHLQLSSYERHKTTDIINVKTLYTDRIGELERAIENMNRNCNQLRMGSDGLLQHNKNLEQIVEKKELELSTALQKSSKLEEENRKLCNQVSADSERHKKAQAYLRDTAPEMEELKLRLDDTKISLGSEQLKSSDIETKCKHLEGELKLKTSVLEKELCDVKVQREEEIGRISERLREDFKDRLQKELQELRLTYDSNMEKNKGDIEIRYEERLRQLKSELTIERLGRALSVEETKEIRGRMQVLIRKVAEFEEEIRSLKNKMEAITLEKEEQYAQYQSLLRAKDEFIKEVNEELAKQIKANEDLQQTTVALDMEIDVFRSLLDSEEMRLDSTEERQHDVECHDSKDDYMI